MSHKIRVLVAKLGLDGHDRGAKVVSRFLRDAGMEVIYTGIRRTPKEVCHIALQEDVDLIGISILSGSHRTLIPKLFDELRQNDLNTPVVVGGIIPEDDLAFLASLGVKSVFAPGASMERIVKKVGEIVAEQRNREAGR